MPSTTQISADEAIRRFAQIRSVHADDLEREELLMELTAPNLQAWAAFGSHAAALLQDGTKILMTTDRSHGSLIVHFAIRLPRSVQLKTFWFNAHSVKSIGELLRSYPQKRMNFGQLLSL